jgi:hypothetical protein
MVDDRPLRVALGLADDVLSLVAQQESTIRHMRYDPRQGAESGVFSDCVKNELLVITGFLAWHVGGRAVVFGRWAATGEAPRLGFRFVEVGPSCETLRELDSDGMIEIPGSGLGFEVRAPTLPSLELWLWTDSEPEPVAVVRIGPNAGYPMRWWAPSRLDHRPSPVRTPWTLVAASDYRPAAASRLRPSICPSSETRARGRRAGDRT